jgi:hypothetical protein
LIVKMTTETVIGSLRATGSTDPVVLAAAKDELLSAVKRLRVVALVLIALGAGASLSIVGALAGIPSLAAGAWAWWRTEQNIQTVEAGFAEHSCSLPRRIALVRT